MNVTRLDTHLASKRVNDARAVGSDKTRLRLAVQRCHHLRDVAYSDAISHFILKRTYTYLIGLRNTLRDTGNEADLVLNGFDDGVGSKRGRDVEDGSIRLGLPDSLAQRKHCQRSPRLGRSCTNLFYSAEHGETEMGLAGLLRRYTANHLRAIRKSFSDMESTLQRLKQVQA